MRKVYNQRAPKKINKQRNPLLARKWVWAIEAEERRRKHWNWKLLDAMWEKFSKQSNSPVPFALYGWKWDWTKSMSIHGGVK